MHSKLLGGTIGVTSLAVLAAAALAFGAGGSRSVAAATPAPSPSPTSSGPKYRLPGGVLSPIPLVMPTITSLELQPVVAPGGEIKIDGQNFGTDPGNVCLQWSTVLVQNDFTRGNTLCLTVADWQDTRIIALVPSDVEGVPDQMTRLYVDRASGGESNVVNMQFIATRQEVLVDGSQLKSTIDCSNNTQRDECDFGFGRHDDDDFFFSFGNSGTDRYHMQLANGWTFDRFNFNVVEGDVSVQGQPQLYGSAVDVAVHWSVSGFDASARYGFGLYAVGPKGVPLQ
jgi:hypothetical protein